MRKLAVLCVIFMLGAGVLSGCSGEKTLAPSERETQAQWGLHLQESSTEPQSESESADESVQGEETTQESEELTGIGIAKAKSPVNVRSGPGAKYTQLGALMQDETVKVLDSADPNWWKVEYKGKEGYVYSPYLIMTEE